MYLLRLYFGDGALPLPEDLMFLVLGFSGLARWTRRSAQFCIFNAPAPRPAGPFRRPRRLQGGSGPGPATTR